MHKPSQRMLLVLGLAVLGGLATSVGLAWLRASLSGMAWAGNDWIDYEGEAHGIVGEHPVPADGAYWVTEFRTTGGTDRLISWSAPRWADAPPLEEPLPRWSMANEPIPTKDDDWLFGVERAYGWPMRCLRVSWRLRAKGTADPGEAMHGGILIEEVDWGRTQFTGSITPDPSRIAIGDHRALPLIPIWGGLAANTLVFAVPWLVLAIVLALPGAFVRWRRRRRGRCVSCAYPRPGGAASGPERCPECGLEYANRLPPWGRVSLGLFALLVIGAWAAALGFGVWRALELVPMPPMHRAVLENDAEAIRQRAARGLPIDDQPPRGFYAVGYLLSSSDRPLAWAATLGHEDAVAALIEAGADLSADGNRALNQAAQHGQAGVCRLLLEAGADSSLARRNGTDAFDHALRSRDPHTIEVFLGFVPADDRRRLIAAVHLDPASLRGVLESTRWGYQEREGAMVAAARSARIESMEIMIADGFDVGACQQPLLLEAVESGSIEAVRLLVEAGAPANIRHSYSGQTPLSVAVELGDVEMVDLVLTAGANVRELVGLNETVLHIAARTAPIEVLDRLLAAGAAVDARPTHGTTPLMEAVKFRRLDVIERLLQGGAGVYVKDLGGRTALDHARGYENDYEKVRPAPPEIIAALEAATER